MLDRPWNPNRLAAAPPVGAMPRSPLPPVMIGWLIGSAAFVAAVSAMARWPSIVLTRGHGGAARPIAPTVVGVVVALAVAWLMAGRRAQAQRARRETVALVLVGFGAAWVLWGLIDQHLLRSFELAPGSAWAGPWDGVFHGVGVLAAGIGTSMVSAGRVAPG